MKGTLSLQPAKVSVCVCPSLMKALKYVCVYTSMSAQSLICSPLTLNTYTCRQQLRLDSTKLFPQIPLQILRFSTLSLSLSISRPVYIYVRICIFCPHRPHHSLLSLYVMSCLMPCPRGPRPKTKSTATTTAAAAAAVRKSQRLRLIFTPNGHVVRHPRGLLGTCPPGVGVYPRRSGEWFLNTLPVSQPSLGDCALLAVVQVYIRIINYTAHICDV